MQDILYDVGSGKTWSPSRDVVPTPMIMARRAKLGSIGDRAMRENLLASRGAGAEAVLTGTVPPGRVASLYA